MYHRLTNAVGMHCRKRFILFRVVNCSGWEATEIFYFRRKHKEKENTNSETFLCCTNRKKIKESAISRSSEIFFVILLSQLKNTLECMCNSSTFTCSNQFWHDSLGLLWGRNKRKWLKGILQRSITQNMRENAFGDI